MSWGYTVTLGVRYATIWKGESVRRLPLVSSSAKDSDSYAEATIIYRDSFNELTDLEVLQKLNERSKTELDKMRATSIAPILKKHGEAIPVDPNATIHIIRKAS